MANPFSIICLSPQDWREALPTNRQQIMLRAAQRDHEVIFVETGYFFGRHLRRLFSRERVAPGVHVRKALGVAPWAAKYKLPNALNSAVTARLIRRIAGNLPQPVVLWIYDPRWARLAGSCGEAFAVYDCVDDYAEQATSVRRREFIAACDRIAALRSRLVFATSRTMYERQLRVNPATHLVPNAGDYVHFARAADLSIAAPEVGGLPSPVIGFAGNFLASKVDFTLLAEVAEARREWTLLLIGPARPETVHVLEDLARQPNVHWLGPKPYAELPRYVAAFDVGVIPYVSNAYTRSCFPLKLYEYLAAGKPVVASGLPELAGMEPDVTLTDGRDAFVGAVEDALARGGEAERKRRMQLAARNTWETRTETLLRLVQGELDASELAA
jgi:glycosyltransferase involved in cell wall biosynthesis